MSQSIRAGVLPTAYWWALSRVLLSLEDTCPEPQQSVIMIKAQIRQLGAWKCPCSKLCCSERAPLPLASPAGSYTGGEWELWGQWVQVGDRQKQAPGPGSRQGCLQDLLICEKRYTSCPELVSDHYLSPVMMSNSLLPRCVLWICFICFFFLLLTLSEKSWSTFFT